MQNTEITAASPNLAELAAREQLTPPEHHAVADDATRKEAPPTPEAGHPHVAPDNININVFNPEGPKPESHVPATQAPHPVADAAVNAPVVTEHQVVHPAQLSAHDAHAKPTIVTPEAFAKAEKNLAEYFGAILDAQKVPELTKGLVLSLKNRYEVIELANDDNPARRALGVGALDLNFSGPMIEPNHVMISTTLLDALYTHPIIGKLVKKVPPESAHYKTREQHIADGDAVLNTKAFKNDSVKDLQFGIANLSDEDYGRLINALAESDKLVPHAIDQPIKDAEITAIQDKALELSDMHVAEGGGLVDAAGHAISADASGINNADTRIEVPATKELKPLREAPAEAPVMGV